MGKPFAIELASLSATIQSAGNFDASVIQRFFEDAIGETVFTVGIGGSFTAARLAALLHNERGGVGVAQTTFEFCANKRSLRNDHVALFTGGGGNHDILSAFDSAIVKEARSILVVCGSVGSPIVRRARRYWSSAITEFRLPAGRDGFLATNSLIATCVLLVRAFGERTGTIGFDKRPAKAAEQIANKTLREGRDRFLVLAGGYATPAAVDLESKCSEAALASVMLSDFRHFAHGRHVWLAKRADITAVVALVTPGERRVFRQTRALIPRTIPVVCLSSSFTDGRSTIALLVQVLYFVAGLGKALGRDPGRPGVPAFGRRIYHLKAARQSTSSMTGKGIEKAACDRKRLVGGRDRHWELEFRRFANALQRVRFTAVVFDFDGTLCGTHDRFIGVSEVLHKPILRLLRGGLRLVIATGRGDSCRDALQAIIPQRYWPNVIVGYHNGSVTSTLGDLSTPSRDEKPIDPLIKLASILQRRRLVRLSDIRLHRCQLTIKSKDVEGSNYIARGVQEVIASENLPLRMVYSSHSFDVLSCEASKLNVLKRALAPNETALCVGDRGAWPGNDFELLETPLSLSVDEVSSNPKTCWNLAPAGVRCEQATLFYLFGMNAKRGVLTYSLDRSLRHYKKSFQ